MFKALIIDDELTGAKALQSLLYKYCPEIDVKAIATTVNKGIEAIKECHPDLVFLDIEMPIMDGFELLEKVKEIPFEIIFTTAYDHYASKAFRHNAIDYLLKPVDSDELIEAVRKAELKLRSGQTGLGHIENLIAHLKDEKKVQKLAIHNFEGIVLIDINRIVRLNADSNYTHIF
jgi:two-component system LytT family response regulator